MITAVCLTLALVSVQLLLHEGREDAVILQANHLNGFGQLASRVEVYCEFSPSLKYTVPPSHFDSS